MLSVFDITDLPFVLVFVLLLVAPVFVHKYLLIESSRLKKSMKVYTGEVSIIQIKAAKAEFCISKISSTQKEPRNSALAVLILKTDSHMYPHTYLIAGGL